MPVPGWWVSVLVLLLPLSAYAQAVTLKALTGAWVKTSEPRGAANADTLFIRADSTFIVSILRPRHGLANFEHLYAQPLNYLRGDTLSLSKSDSPEVCQGKRPGFCGEPGYKITLQGPQFTLTPLGKTSTWYSGTYTRVNVQPPKP